MIRLTELPGGAHRIEVENRLAEITELNSTVEQLLRGHGVAGKAVNQTVLCVEEIVCNIITHAFEDDGLRLIEVVLEAVPSRITVTISDDGVAFDPTAHPVTRPDREAPEADRELGGLGLHLVRALVERMEYERVGGRNRVTLQKSIETG